MKAEKPAEGIMVTRKFNDSTFYAVKCKCGNDDDEINFEVEVDHTINEILVNTWTIQKTDFWTEAVNKRYNIENIWYQEFDWFWKDIWNGLCTRIRLTKDIWWNGYIKYQSTTVMSKQQALNYAETLKKAINDLEKPKPIDSSKK